MLSQRSNLGRGKPTFCVFIFLYVWPLNCLNEASPYFFSLFILVLFYDSWTWTWSWYYSLQCMNSLGLLFERGFSFLSRWLCDTYESTWKICGCWLYFNCWNLNLNVRLIRFSGVCLLGIFPCVQGLFGCNFVFPLVGQICLFSWSWGRIMGGMVCF